MQDSNKTQLAQAGISVRTATKAGGIRFNHNERPAGISVRTATKAGGIRFNHNERPAR